MHLDHPDLPTAVTALGNVDGEPIIVIPGGPCRGPEYLVDLAGLGDSHPLLVMHPRGTPRSGGLSRGWWSDADDVIALADALGQGSVNLLAHSAGTRLALATATRFPERVRSLALVTPPASWLSGTPHDGEEIAAGRAEADVAAALVSMANDDPTAEEAFRESFRRQAPASYARWTDVERAHAEVGAISLAAASAWFTDIPADAVTRIRAATLPPTLVIGGDQDLLTGVRPVRDYADALGGDLSLIADCGHYPWIEQPEVFQRLVDAWLAAHR
ncbi:alpha/beta fold hydrolase [Microbacterium sp. 18062]|uniref:alpha/beta fold hydrolase n=1 Tax=Microbacterium sp. 18062 TaxID=2681410 RepID=UPI001F2069BA|nr:alpha/beta hydrolase [Microbacterium sp. 18062]